MHTDNLVLSQQAGPSATVSFDLCPPQKLVQGVVDRWYVSSPGVAVDEPPRRTVSDTWDTRDGDSLLHDWFCF